MFIVNYIKILINASIKYRVVVFMVEQADSSNIYCFIRLFTETAIINSNVTVFVQSLYSTNNFILCVYITHRILNSSLVSR